mgnify:CR=1 FL=1
MAPKKKTKKAAGAEGTKRSTRVDSVDVFLPGRHGETRENTPGLIMLEKPPLPPPGRMGLFRTAFDARRAGTVLKGEAALGVNFRGYFVVFRKIFPLDQISAWSKGTERGIDARLQAAAIYREPSALANAIVPGTGTLFESDQDIADIERARTLLLDRVLDVLVAERGFNEAALVGPPQTLKDGSVVFDTDPVVAAELFARRAAKALIEAANESSSRNA